MLGLNVLVVEEQYLVAAEIEATLVAKGAAGIVIARDIHGVDATAPIDLAIVEAKLGAPEVVDFSRQLRQAGIAVVVTSADRAVASLFKGSVSLEKPFDEATLLAACNAALGASSELRQV